jgi:hypothetical protein
LAEKAVGDADRTFKTWIEIHKKCNQINELINAIILKMICELRLTNIITRLLEGFNECPIPWKSTGACGM